MAVQRLRRCYLGSIPSSLSITRLEKFLIAGSSPAHTANLNQALVDKGPLAQERAAP